MIISSSYLEKVFNPNKFQNVLERTLGVVRKVQKLHPFESIAFTGVSGASVAFPISFITKIPLLLVRKDKDGSHSYRGTEGHVDTTSYIIIDDFISSGETVRRIISKIAETIPGARCKAIITWSGHDSDPFLLAEYPGGIPIFSSAE